jgi:hypothetical protein
MKALSINSVIYRDNKYRLNKLNFKINLMSDLVLATRFQKSFGLTTITSDPTVSRVDC